MDSHPKGPNRKVNFSWVMKAGSEKQSRGWARGRTVGDTNLVLDKAVREIHVDLKGSALGWVANPHLPVAVSDKVATGLVGKKRHPNREHAVVLILGHNLCVPCCVDGWMGGAREKARRPRHL
jgi:hypothetical protein